MKKLFIGFFYATEDEQEHNFLLFVADENCDREKEFMSNFEFHYDKKIDTADITEISPVISVLDKNNIAYKIGIKKE